MKCENCNACTFYLYGRGYCNKKHYTICDDFERKNMTNIKITAEVNGKQVPLETVSTETFEAIKALEKPKEIPVPVARVGNYRGDLPDKRLFLKLTNSIRENAADVDFNVIAINLRDGHVNNSWQNDNDADNLTLYENVKPL